MSVCSNAIKPQFHSQQHRTETSRSNNQQPLDRNKQNNFRARLRGNFDGKPAGRHLSNLIGNQLRAIRAGGGQRGGGQRCGNGNAVGGHKNNHHHQNNVGKNHFKHQHNACTNGNRHSQPAHIGKGFFHHHNEGARGGRNAHQAHGGRGYFHHHNECSKGNRQSQHSYHAHGNNNHNRHHHVDGTRGGRHAHHAHGHHKHHHFNNDKAVGHRHHNHGATGVANQNTRGTCGTTDTNTVKSLGNSGVSLQIKGLLQGAYKADTGLMTDALREQNLLPGSQPYESLGHTGAETLSASTLATTGKDAPTDWVLIELRDKNNPDVVVTSQAAVIQRDGDVANADTNTTDLHFDVPEGDYFVTLGHRNHLDVTTSSAVSLGGENGTLIDFTNPDTVKNGQTTTIGGEAALWAGDANADNSVVSFGPQNDADTLVSTVLTSEGNTNFSFDYEHFGYANSDFNLDGVTVLNGENSDKDLLNSNTDKVGGNITESDNFVLEGSTDRS
ncbi:MAG: hypothetical protein ACPGSM_21170 [Thiolinea sp.]